MISRKGGYILSRKRVLKCILKNRLAPAMCLIGVGMVLAIVIPFWLWVLLGGIGLICYGFWNFFC